MTYEQARDRGGRHLPAHRDVRAVRHQRDWWGWLRESTKAVPDTPQFTYNERMPMRRGHPLGESEPS